MVYRGKILFYRKNYTQLSEIALRLMLAVMSLFKMLAWSVACLVPRWVRRARRELWSNIEVLRLCARLE